MENRKQFVSFDICNSDVRYISCGVPQGSILSSKLSIPYISEKCNISNLMKFILFADDTYIFHANSNISSLNEAIICVLEDLCILFTVNKLTVSIRLKPILCYLEAYTQQRIQ